MARRRVVTGLDAQGRSIIVSEGPSPGRFESGEWEEIWAFDRLPASITDPADPVAIDRFRLTPLPGQIAVRLFTIAGHDGADRSTASLEWAQKIDHAETEAPSDESPWMHRTPTIDIIVIVSGEMDLMLDGGHVVHLVPGDSVVQPGTMHAWRNTATEPCLAVAVMVRAE
jgi:mannose-6-phosphate isomerase-like protein (cupin superfamily)